MATGKAFGGGFMEEKLDHRGEINFVRIINANDESVFTAVELNR